MNENDSPVHRVVLVTGMSGAGKSVALRALEDLGYEAIDNLPLTFVPAVLKKARARGKPIAIGCDARVHDFVAEELLTLAGSLRAEEGLRFDLLFLDCDDEVLQRRYTETRRKHPLASDRAVSDGIRHERQLLRPVRAKADWMVDTTLLSANELRHMLTEQYQLGRQNLSLMVVSFSYRNGLPREADLVFDVRFLRNPFYDPALKDHDGRVDRVGAYIEQDPAFAAFFENLTRLLTPLLPRYLEEGKSYLTFAVGCTGGRHRSVFTAEKLAGFLRNLGYNVGVRHRELSPTAPSAPPQ